MKVPVKFPQEAELLIQAGQTVDFSTPLLRKKDTNKVRIPLSDILKFQPDKIFLSLKKGVGDSVNQGDLLAENKGMFSTKQYFSSVDGVIREIDHLTGTTTIELKSDKDSVIPCFFTGEIAEIGDDYIELKVTKAQKFDTEENSHYLGAPVFYIVDYEKPLTEDNILEKVIVGANINPLDHAKIETLGAKAYISNMKAPLGGIKQIILPSSEDLEIVMKEKFPFVISGLDNKSIYFYH